MDAAGLLGLTWELYVRPEGRRAFLRVEGLGHHDGQALLYILAAVIAGGYGRTYVAYAKKVG